MTLWNTVLNSGQMKTSSLLQNLFIVGKYPCNSFSNCHCLFTLISSNNMMPASLCQAPQSTLQSSRFPPLAQAQVPQLLQGCFASKFHQDRQVWAPDDDSSAIRRCLHHCKYELACFAQYVGLGANDVSAEWQKSGDDGIFQAIYYTFCALMCT